MLPNNEKIIYYCPKSLHFNEHYILIDSKSKQRKIVYFSHYSKNNYLEEKYEYAVEYSPTGEHIQYQIVLDLEKLLTHPSQILREKAKELLDQKNQ